MAKATSPQGPIATSDLVALANPLPPSVQSGCVQYRDLEERWWKEYCNWKLDADARGRAILQSKWTRDAFGRLTPPNARVAKQTQAGELGEAKRRGVKQHLHRVEGLPVSLNISPPPRTPADPERFATLTDSDQAAVMSARLINCLAQNDGSWPHIESYVGMTATAGVLDLAECAGWHDRWKTERAVAPSARLEYSPDDEHTRALDEQTVRRAYRAADRLRNSILDLVSQMQLVSMRIPERIVYYTDLSAKKARPARPEELEGIRRERDRQCIELVRPLTDVLINARLLAQSIKPIQSVVLGLPARDPLLLWHRRDAFTVAEHCAIEAVSQLAKAVATVAAPMHDHHRWGWWDSRESHSLPADLRAKLLEVIDQVWLRASLGGAAGWGTLLPIADLQRLDLALRREEEDVLGAWRQRPRCLEYATAARVVRYIPSTQTVTWDERTARIDHPKAAKYFELVINATGNYVSPAQVFKGAGDRPTRLKDRLPRSVLSLIEIVPRKGTRMAPQTNLV